MANQFNVTKMNIGDFAIYGKCKVQISSVRLQGIAAPYYRFFCVEQGNHNHPKEWGSLISYRLLSSIGGQE